MGPLVEVGTDGPAVDVVAVDELSGGGIGIAVAGATDRGILANGFVSCSSLTTGGPAVADVLEISVGAVEAGLVPDDVVPFGPALPFGAGGGLTAGELAFEFG